MKSTHLGFKYLVPHQINKEITVNENFELLEKLLLNINAINDPSVISIEQVMPVFEVSSRENGGNNSNNDNNSNKNSDDDSNEYKNKYLKYIVKFNAIGEWHDKRNNIAIYYNGKWEYFMPSEGTIFYVIKSNAMYIYVRGMWRILKVNIEQY